ncbi:Ctr copper transporter family-domain-containing protein [Apodospora peruviana]|uniref:Copper transport protein n=1 Tax=Apodospora peruviana TaxID=516989 RepID=A0AAE0ME21_9PEZI|nr:Ctr copper transporter family-domain-containing protein [Apodospora peruviana]
MDHSDHSHAHHMGMDHGGMDHGGGEMAHGCSMNMLFTWDTKNLCIIYRWWHIGSTLQLVISLLAIVVIVAGYEALREGIRRYEIASNKRAESIPQEESVTETTPFLWSTGQNRVEVTRRAHVIKSILYGVQNFYAFMIMLIFMTYNGWVMISVSVGAALGYLIFGGRTTATKDTACH